MKYSQRSIIDEIRRQRTRDAIQDVQARANSLRVLSNAKGVDNAIVSQISHGNTHALRDEPRKGEVLAVDLRTPESWVLLPYCGFEALSSPGTRTLANPLLTSSKNFSKRSGPFRSAYWTTSRKDAMADERTAPWSEVPELLTLEGSERLPEIVQRYTGCVRSQPPPFDPGMLSVEQLRDRVDRLPDIVEIDALLGAEKEGKARAGAFRARRRNGG